MKYVEKVSIKVCIDYNCFQELLDVGSLKPSQHARDSGSIVSKIIALEKALNEESELMSVKMKDDEEVASNNK